MMRWRKYKFNKKKKIWNLEFIIQRIVLTLEKKRIRRRRESIVSELTSRSQFSIIPPLAVLKSFYPYFQVDPWKKFKSKSTEMNDISCLCSDKINNCVFVFTLIHKTGGVGCVWNELNFHIFLYIVMFFLRF